MFRTKAANKENESKSKGSHTSNITKSIQHLDEDSSSDEEMSQTSSIEGSTVTSGPFKDDIDSVMSKGYSADIQPLKFNVNRSPEETEAMRTMRQYPDSLSKVKEKLLKGSGSSSNWSNEATLRHFLGSIDREQFENYLKEPHYIKMLKRGKNLKQFRRLFLAQELKAYEDDGKNSKSKTPTMNSEAAPRAIWVTKFSLDGKFMATGSKDGTVWLWKVISSPVERWELDVTEETNKAVKAKTMILKQQVLAGSPNSTRKDPKLSSVVDQLDARKGTTNLYAPVFHPNPFKVFREHTSDILDINWSKNNFIATASMDKTVSLWHPERLTSLKTFIHPDFVTCVIFHPCDDRFLISGCLDHKCRLWSILDSEVVFEFDCQDLITSITLSPDDGEYTIIGTFNGYIHVLATRGLDFVLSFHITDKETQEENAKPVLFEPGSKTHHGPRVTSLQCYKPPADNSLRLVVTSNDSRIRVFNLKTKKCLEILKGFQSGTSQHSAQLTFWRNQPIVVCGSDDHWVYSWKLRSPTAVEPQKDSTRSSKPGTLRGLLSNALGPNNESKPRQHHNALHLRNLLPHAHGCTNDQVIKNNYSVSFHAHHAPVTTANIAPADTSKALSLSNDLICELSLQFYKESDNLDLVGRVKEESSDSDRESIETETSAATGRRSMSADADVTFPLPSVVDAIGTIMVTTDTTGIIRIFRADMPSNIRKRVLEKIQEFSAPGQKQLSSSDSLNTINQGSIHTDSSTNRLHSNSFIGGRNSGVFNDFNPANLPARHLRASSVFKNSLFNHSNGSLGSSRTPRGSVSSVATEEDHNTKNNNVHNGATPKLRCEVCNGTKFNTMPNASQATRDAGYYCAECGTMLNNFR